MNLGALQGLWGSHHAAFLCALSAMWGFSVWLLWDGATPLPRLALVAAVHAHALVALRLLASQPGAALACLALALVPLVLRVAYDTAQPGHVEMALLLASAAGAAAMWACARGASLAAAQALNAQADELAARLRTQMIITDEARHAAEEACRAAEAANRAKTQFFAAASHDLRQPLHAMGLFAQALRLRTHEPEVAALVDSIDASVDALDGLFGELLDITRIDTGDVQAHATPVPLGELFGRLRLHFAPVAFEKGLMLSFRGDRHVAHADPVLLERVLRNLVSNAIRYTEDGGVLVSCRRRGGAAGALLLLQVWDSGIGIAPESLPRIWDEFFQAQPQRPLQAHHRKGLGLGLAIVKRLAWLMRAPISVRSRLGHGSVFSLELPLAETAPGHVIGMGQGQAVVLNLTLQGRLIVLVDGDAAARETLPGLMRGWGARVLAFDTAEAVQAWCEGAAAEAPDLQLVDEAATQAVELLRERWPGRPLPTIVMATAGLDSLATGARQPGCRVLAKPVAPNKLRALIAAQLR